VPPGQLRERLRKKMEAPEQGIARSGSSSSSSSFDDERESDLLLFRNWLYYRVDSALGKSTRQSTYLVPFIE
jgi:hypothetical protein